MIKSLTCAGLAGFVPLLLTPLVLAGDASEVFDTANDSVVSVSRHAWLPLTDPDSYEMEISDAPISGGSGVVIACPVDFPAGLLDGLSGEEREQEAEFYRSGQSFGGICVITNCHVVGQSGPVVVSSGDESLKVVRSLQNYPADFCLVSQAWDESKRLSNAPARIGASGDLNVGDRIYAVGNPSGLTNTITSGIVSGFREHAGVRIIQISAPISPGSSGGGLFNSDGELVGLTTSKIVGAEGIGFAIPIELLESLWDVEFRRRTATAPIIHDHFHMRAFRFEARQDWDDLLGLAQDWITLDEWDAEAWLALGTAYTGLSDRDRAIDALQRSIEIDPAAGAQRKLGTVYLIESMVANGSDRQNRESVAIAVSVLEGATRTNPYDGAAWGSLAMAYVLSRWPERALEAASRSIELDHQESIAWRACGRAYYELNMMREALDCLRTSTRLEPRISSDWYLLGVAAERVGEDGLVLDAYQNLRRLNPELAELFFESLD